MGSASLLRRLRGELWRLRGGFLLAVGFGLLSGATLPAQQYLVCPEGYAVVKVPKPGPLSSNGIFELEFACVPAPTNAVLGVETEVRFGDNYFQLNTDSSYDIGSLMSTIPSSLEHVRLTDGTVTTQVACDPSYQGGLTDPTNLAWVQPPDPPPGLGANARTRAATSIQQAVMACLTKATSFTSPEFLDSLGVSAQVKQWYAQGYRSDLEGLTRFDRPLIQFLETTSPSFLAVLEDSNNLLLTFMTGTDYLDFASRPALSPAYDCGVVLGDYAGLVASWMIACTNGFSGRSISFWQQNNLYGLNDGLSAWVAYLNDGNPEVYKYASYAIRQAAYPPRPCGKYNYPDCFKGNNIRNVMMHDETNTTKDGVYPFLSPNNLNSYDGPVDWDLAGIYFAAVFYDISQEVGLGDTKANLLFWKTISLIDVCGTFTMRDFGRYVLLAANELWPDPAHPGLSYYDAPLKDVLRSRGIAIGSEADFRVNLPPPIGPTRKASALLFGSSHPSSQPAVSSYGGVNYFENSYTHAGATTNDYVVYQFYKHSKEGPCDKLILTDGTFTDPGNGFYYNTNGSYYHELQDRELGNLLLMVPGPTIDWVRKRMRCATEHEGFYAEDVRPFGFIVTQAIKNGFVWKTTRWYALGTNIMYKFEIVDPSQATLGPATYDWTFTAAPGFSNRVSGASVFQLVPGEQPLEITVSRVRGGETNTITMSEPSSGLDKGDRPHWLVGIRTPQNALSAEDAPHYFNIEPSPVFTSYNRAGDGSFTLNFSGITNATYSLWASTNLATWESLGSATQLSPGAYQFVDAAGTNLVQRFYQVRKP